MPNGEVKLTWGDGEHTFNVAKIGQALELEEKCNCGVAELFDRLRNGTWYINDVRETIRLGLIGGGLAPPKAVVLVKRYVDDRPWSESVQPALLIMMAAMVGVPGDEVGKKPTADQTESELSATMADLFDPPSMDLAQSSDGTRA